VHRKLCNGPSHYFGGQNFQWPNVSELIPVLGSQTAADVSHKPDGRLPFPPGLQLLLQPVRGLLPILLLGEQKHNGCEQFA